MWLSQSQLWFTNNFALILMATYDSYLLFFIIVCFLILALSNWARLGIYRGACQHQPNMFSHHSLFSSAFSLLILDGDSVWSSAYLPHINTVSPNTSDNFHSYTIFVNIFICLFFVCIYDWLLGLIWASQWNSLHLQLTKQSPSKSLCNILFRD